jgi:hypothetical protein
VTNINPQHGESGQTAPTPRASSPLTRREISEAFAKSEYGPILTLQQSAELSHYKPSTLRRKASEGLLKGAVSRGKPLLFW